jgi:hypothetical protein
LKLGDIVTLGETTLEFTTADAGTMLLLAPARQISEIQAEQKTLEDHKKKVRSMGFTSLFGGGSTSTDALGTLGSKPSEQAGKRKLILMGVGVLAVIFFLLPDENGSKKQNKKPKTLNSEDARNLASYLPGAGGPNRAADTFFKDGFREYLAGNFNRARLQFETVLQVSPGHTLAILYLENCVKAINTEVEFHLEYGKKSLDSGKLRESKGHYERILRLLYKDQSNENFIKAKDYLDQVNKEIRNESNSTTSSASPMEDQKLKGDLNGH